MSRESKNNEIRHAKVSNNDNNTKTLTNTQTKQQTRPVQSLKKEQKSDTKENNGNSPNYKQKSLDTKKRKAIWGIILIGGTLIVGTLASIVGGKMRDGYTKPPACPPDWVFPVVWTILYIAIGIASFLVYIHTDNKKQRTNDLIWFAIHMFFNMLWPLFFFRLDMLIFSCIWLVFMIITAIIVTYKYYKAYTASGVIFTVYTLWLLFALYLSLAVTMINLM